MANPQTAVPGLKNPGITFPRPGILHLKWDDNSIEDGATPTDRLVVLVINPSGAVANKIIVTSSARKEMAADVPVSGISTDDSTQVIWAGFIRTPSPVLSNGTLLPIQP